ncbi:MAG: hypothetical protein L3J79_10650 [Candidatus Marinimicrobia bacterium]|nr:hypothetical protein [Candidatus Neomarinimicrobiota bacterium]
MLLTLALMLLTGCYNNSHIRTQRVLKTGEKVISAHMGLNLIAPTDYNNSYRIRHTGISGTRMGLSYLGLHRGYEQGASVSLGLMDDVFDFIVGYDIRKVQANTAGDPYRYGLYFEVNNIMGESNYGTSGGTVFQIRPYFMSVTSEQKQWYGGIHGIMSFGSLDGKDYTWNEYDEILNNYSYSTSTLGAGLTFGAEARAGSYLMQSQVDISVINQKNKLFEGGVLEKFPEYRDFAPLNQSGLVVTISSAIHKAPLPKPAEFYYPGISTSSPELLIDPWQTDQKVTYDPFTGRLITPDAVAEPLRFDPLTGELVSRPKPLVFDPQTGLAVPDATHALKRSPYSLLTTQERFSLIQKGLTIQSLNGVLVDAVILDVKDTGVLVQRVILGSSGQETIPFNKINWIRFVGARKGWDGAVSGALTGCGVCVALPLAASMLLDSSGLFAMGLVAAPVAGLGGLVFGALDRASYELILGNNPTTLTEFEYRRNAIVRLVKIYQVQGFPDYDLLSMGK